MEDYNLGVLQKFEITVVCGQKFNWYMRTLSLKSQKVRKIVQTLLKTNGL